MKKILKREKNRASDRGRDRERRFKLLESEMNKLDNFNEIENFLG